MKLMTLVATFLTLSSLCAQGSPEDGLSRWKDQSVQQQPVGDPLLRWMNKIAQQELQAREKRVADRLLLHTLVLDRKSTRLNSSHLVISYAVFCLKKKKRA